MGGPDLWVFGLSFGVYSLAIVGVGLWSARYSTGSDEDYLLAGRSLGRWLAALSASASSESGWVTLGLVGWAFTEGVKAYWIIPGCVLGFIFNWFVLAGPLSDRSRELGAITVTDFFTLHFRERVPLIRIVSSLAIAVAMWLYVAAQFAAAGKSFSAAFNGVDYRLGVLIGAGIVLIYTVTGGFRAVCWTDFVQGFLMVGTLVVFPLFLLAHAGGPGPTMRELHALDPAMLHFVPEMPVMALIGFLLGAGALGINFGYPGQPHVLIRFMSLSDRREAIPAGVISVVWAVLVYSGAVTIGLFARGMAQAGEEWARLMLDKPEIYGELALVLSAMNLLPGVLSGLVLAAVLAAICSTADSQLMVAGSTVSNDLYVRQFEKDGRRSHLWLNRLSILVLGLAAVLLVLNQEIRVYKFVLTYGWAILGATFGPQMILTLFWRRASYAGCLAGMLTGFTVALVWPSVYDAAATGVEIYNLPLAFVTALVVNVVVSLMSVAEPAARIAGTATGE